jgi:hypothetical protein
MLTLEQIVSRLHDRNLKKVAEACDLNHVSLCKLIREPSDRCEYRTVKKLSDYLEANK